MGLLQTARRKVAAERSRRAAKSMSGAMTSEGAAAHFVLSNDIPLEIASPPGTPQIQRWQSLVHYGVVRPALILLAGESLTLPPCEVATHTRLYLGFGRGLPSISADGLTIDLSWVPDGGEPQPLLSVPLHNGQDTTFREAVIDLSPHAGQAGRVSLRVGAGPAGDPSADWLALSELVLGPAHELDLLRARAFSTLRSDNERAHFEAVYDHAIYEGRRKRALKTKPLPPRDRPAPRDYAPVAPADLAPTPGEDVYHYGSRLLRQCLHIQTPAFHQRIADLAHAKGGEGLDIISFCAGTAQVEAALAASTDADVRLTLVDINDHLLEQAEAIMPPNCSVELIVQNVNELSLPERSFDIAIFVSGVHHVVELEHVWGEIRTALRPNGELWLIGEQIGANGNRLDVPEYARANAVFQSLPERYRINSVSGEVDADLQNRDCAEATFEGIRSADIEPTLSRHFLPVEIYRRNCFLWRLLNQTYHPNYDLNRPEDVETVQALAQAELDLFRAGGRPTELHGIYRPIL